MQIYLAYPIDKANRGAQEVVRDIRQWLPQVVPDGSVMYDPAGAFIVGREPLITEWLSTVNGHAQQGADAVLVIWPAGAHSWGVPVEVERAIQNGQAVAVVTDQDQPTWSQPWINGHNIREFRVDHLAAWGIGGWRGRVADALQYLGHLPLTTGAPHEPSGHVEPTPVVPGAPEAVQSLPFASTEFDPFDGNLPMRLPTRAYPDDAGLDLYVVGDHIIEPNQFYDLPSRVAVELPDWSWGYLTGRSSTLRKKHLLVNPAVIDCGYRGELFSGVWNLGSMDVTVHDGERVAQLIIIENATRRLRPVAVPTVREHERGSNGFGSSGA